MNRISHQFEKPCRCCRVRRRLKRLEAEAVAVEKIAGNVFEFVVPTVQSFLKGNRTVRLFPQLECDAVPVGTDLRMYAAQTLRALSHELAGAADRLDSEGGEQ